MRVKAVIAYDGTDFEGFQRQTRTSNTITTAIETALESLQIDSPIIGSGRTDAGVHATGQVIHFDLPPFWDDLGKLREHLNGRLHTIRFKHISKVSDDFHARFDAKIRTYRYLFSSEIPDVFRQRYLSYIPINDMEKLESALKIFEGTHDFGSFKKKGSETKNDVRTIRKIHLKHYGKIHAITIESNGFLRAQIRLMMGAAFASVGQNHDQDILRNQLELHERFYTETAPANGLYLAKIIY